MIGAQTSRGSESNNNRGRVKRNLVSIWSVRRRIRRKMSNSSSHSSSDSSHSESEEMTATTLPTSNFTWWDKSRYKIPPHRRMETPRTALGSTLGSRPTTTITTSGTKLTIRTTSSGSTRTVYNVRTSRDSGRSDNIVDTQQPISIGLTATLASLGVIVVLLIVLIAYLGYFR